HASAAWADSSRTIRARADRTAGSVATARRAAASTAASVSPTQPSRTRASTTSASGRDAIGANGSVPGPTSSPRYRLASAQRAAGVRATRRSLENTPVVAYVYDRAGKVAAVRARRGI